MYNSNAQINLYDINFHLINDFLITKVWVSELSGRFLINTHLDLTIISS